MANFNLNDYQTVEERIHLFWQRYPNGRIINEIIFDDGERVVIKSEVYVDKDDTRPTTVDFAEEIKASKGVNSDSRIENGTTSATGRALSLLGGEFSPKGKRPSRSEMEKVQRRQTPQAAPTPPQPMSELARRQNALLDRLNALPQETRADAKKQFLENFGKPSEVSEQLLDLADAFVAELEISAYEPEPPF